MYVLDEVEIGGGGAYTLQCILGGLSLVIIKIIVLLKEEKIVVVKRKMKKKCNDENCTNVCALHFFFTNIFTTTVCFFLF